MAGSRSSKPAARPGPPRQPAPPSDSLSETRADAAHCTACPLWKNATQTVFGEGRVRATVMLVGEQPGDQEDLAGRPFVGPAGRLLDRALTDAGIDRSKLYVTNAVKHFKHEPRGKRRIHKKPSDAKIEACYQWLEREIELGAKAARSVLGRATPIERNRRRLLEISSGAQLLITVHPSMLLRIPDQYKADAYRQFIEDLKLAAPFVTTGKG